MSGFVVAASPPTGLCASGWQAALASGFGVGSASGAVPPPGRRPSLTSSSVGSSLPARLSQQARIGVTARATPPSNVPAPASDEYLGTKELSGSNLKRVEGFNVARPGSAGGAFSHSVVPFRKTRSIQTRPSTSPTSTTDGFVGSGVLDGAQELRTMGFAPADQPSHRSTPRTSTRRRSSTSSFAEPAELLILPPVSVPAEGLLHKQLAPPRTSNADQATLAHDPSLPPSPIAGRPLDMSSANSVFLHSPSKLAVRLLAACQEKHAVFDSPIVVKAFNIAAGAHEGQRWQDGESFLRHAAETACILADLGLDDTTVAAGLLHAVLDLTMMTSEVLHRLLPSAVVEMVERVSRMNEVSQLHRAAEGSMDAATTRKLRSMLLSMADVRVVLVKLAERVHSMRTISGCGPSQRAAAAREALELFAPLANRLGVWALKAELEDYAFYTQRPEEYAALKARVTGDGRSITGSLDKLKGALADAGVAAEDLSGRPKNLHGLFQKMQKKGYTMDEIYDVRAVRVIVSSKTDCYAALREVHRLWAPVEGRFKDYIRHSKKNGYQSLHTVVRGDDGVPFEVQIRTAKMHYIAEHGVAAHWRYKEEGGLAALSDSGSLDESLDVVTEAHVAFARWLITWELELADKKCRPTGSPEQDNALSALASEMACSFPEHSKHCPFRGLQMGRPEQPSLDASPVYCVIVHRAEGHGESHTELRELPAGTTTSGLLASGALGNPVGKQLLVNHRHEAARGQTLLHMGDQVEVVDEAPAEAPGIELDWQELPGDLLEDALPSPAVPDDLEQQRQRFNHLFYEATPARKGSSMQPAA